MKKAYFTASVDKVLKSSAVIILSNKRESKGGLV